MSICTEDQNLGRSKCNSSPAGELRRPLSAICIQLIHPDHNLTGLPLRVEIAAAACTAARID